MTVDEFRTQQGARRPGRDDTVFCNTWSWPRSAPNFQSTAGRNWVSFHPFATRLDWASFHPHDAEFFKS